MPPPGGDSPQRIGSPAPAVTGTVGLGCSRGTITTPAAIRCGPMRTAIVTGASSGIGADTARRLGRDGYHVMLVARRRDRLEELAAEIGNAHALAVDITTDDGPAQLRAHMETEHDGRLDLLVNNA